MDGVWDRKKPSMTGQKVFRMRERDTERQNEGEGDGGSMRRSEGE